MSWTTPQRRDGTVRVLLVKNTTSEDIPPFALMRVSGIDSDGNIQVAKPNADGQTDILVNSPVVIPAGLVGQAHAASPCAVLYDTADGTPATGETWGAGSGTWKLKKNKYGAQVIGGADSTEALVNVLHGWGGAVNHAIGVQTVDGTPSYTGVTTLRFDEADGFVVTQPAANVVRLDMAPASASQAGIVDTNTQFFAGNKGFTNRTYFDGRIHYRRIGVPTILAGAHPSLTSTYHINYFSVAGEVEIQGIEIVTGETDGQIIGFVNLSSQYPVILRHESASATAGMRLNLPGGADVVLNYLDGYHLFYDEDTYERWLTLSGHRSQMAMSDILAFAAAHG